MEAAAVTEMMPNGEMTDDQKIQTHNIHGMDEIPDRSGRRLAKFIRESVLEVFRRAILCGCLNHKTFSIIEVSD